MLAPGKRYAVFSIKKIENGSGGPTGGVLWTRAGNAFINKDGSMNVYLDVLPMDGRLHVRDGGERKEAPGGVSGRPQVNGTPAPGEVTVGDPRLRTPAEYDAEAAAMAVAS